MENAQIYSEFNCARDEIREWYPNVKFSGRCERCTFFLFPGKGRVGCVLVLLKFL